MGGSEDGAGSKDAAGSKDNVVRMDGERERLRSAFLGWQCRLRQLAVREDGARPSSGMRPHLAVAGEDVGRITVLITPSDPEVSTGEFRHLVRRTNDPRERYQAALRHLQAAHFQEPRDFGDRLTAVFAVDSVLVERLTGRDDCLLTFEQFSQLYRLPCRAVRLEEADPAFQATYWHNALFNPNLPARVDIVAFLPDWDHAQAEPPPPARPAV